VLRFNESDIISCSIFHIKKLWIDHYRTDISYFRRYNISWRFPSIVYISWVCCSVLYWCYVMLALFLEFLIHQFYLS